jgi:FMN phosphatase YigB (HAD superfamily)
MISFIYFDVGGVVINDFSGNNGWSTLKQALGVSAEQDNAFMEAFYPLEHQVLVGRDIETIVPELAAAYNLHLPADYSMLQGFVQRFTANKAIWPAVAFARQHYKVGLLTNMYPHMLVSITARNLMPQTTWDTIIDSSVEGHKKPEPALFEIAQKAAGFPGEEILFIDNTLGHVEAARAFGWQAYYYDATNHEDSSRALLAYMIDLYENK